MVTEVKGSFDKILSMSPNVELFMSSLRGVVAAMYFVSITLNSLLIDEI